MRHRGRAAPVLALLAWLGSGCGAPAPQPAEGTAAAGRAPVPADVPEAPTASRPVVPPPAIPPQVALEVIDLQTGGALMTQRPDILDRPVHPGSVAKVFTLRAALDAGDVDARSRVECRGRESVGNRILECAHPRFGRPLSASEALAHSCNSFFVAVAKRLTWLPIADCLRRAGLPATPAPREPALGAVGLDGPQPSPRALLVAFAKIVAEAQRLDRPQDRVLLDGLREAARNGTASALGEQGLDAFAKTGSGRILGGAPGGLVVAVVPAGAPRYGVVVIGAGIAGRDAASIAGAALQRAAPSLAQSRYGRDERGPVRRNRGGRRLPTSAALDSRSTSPGSSTARRPRARRRCSEKSSRSRPAASPSPVAAATRRRVSTSATSRTARPTVPPGTRHAPPRRRRTASSCHRGRGRAARVPLRRMRWRARVSWRRLARPARDREIHVGSSRSRGNG